MSTSLEQKIGSRLKLARMQANLSVSDLALKLSVPDQEVLSLEAGEMRFSARRVSQLAALFELEIRWFFSDLNDIGPCFDKQNTTNLRGIADLIATARSKGFLGDLVNANKQDQTNCARSKAA
ncbi:MAG: helix-turn-helix transcriptional regulator [Pseudomonadota bacterium]|nr:helix-turn-helix transcriptional regulator [Pseudomonadota bacterium]